MSFTIANNPLLLKQGPTHRVLVRGQYEPQYQILIDNRVHQGQAGYHVLTPLRIEDGNVRILVNRGWVPMGADRAQIPRLETPGALVEVEGVATVPQTGGFHLGTARPAGTQWQPVWQYLDLSEYARHVPFPVQPVVVLLAPQSPAGGFARHWARLDTGIGRGACRHLYFSQYPQNRSCRKRNSQPLSQRTHPCAAGGAGYFLLRSCSWCRWCWPQVCILAAGARRAAPYITVNWYSPYIPSLT